jgi:SIR2-like domain
MQLQPKYRLIFLGAGFSCPAGLPLANELWKSIRKETASFSPDLRASKFNDDLKQYIRFRKEAYAEDISEDDVDFEDFMRFLDVEHFLGLRGSDTWGPEGNEGTVVTKYLVGKVLAQHCNRLVKLPTLYTEFAKRLQPGDTVITFNYDVLLERALEEVGKPYRLFPTRFETVHQNHSVVDSSHDDEIVLLKVHGSIDWFDKSFAMESMKSRQSLNLGLPRYSIFSQVEQYGLEKIASGPRPDNDPTVNLYRAKNLDTYYANGLSFFEPPKLLTPSSAKLLYSNSMHDFWNGIAKTGHYNFGMAIIGFSLPNHDEYVKQILYNVVRNYQRSNWEDGLLGLKKSPLILVDYFREESSERSYRERYRFVDWNRASLIGTGFDEKSLDVILS